MLKRAFDIVAAGAGLALLGLPMAGIAGLIRLVDGHGALHREKRVGLDGKAFDILKFKTMNDARDESGALLPDDKRETALGRALRHTALDELPQLFNILKGEMSVVGPRPHSFEEAAAAPEIMADIVKVRPGLTGPWQVASIGRRTGADERLALDRAYALGKPSLAGDIGLIARTVPALILGHDKDM